MASQRRGDTDGPAQRQGSRPGRTSGSLAEGPSANFAGSAHREFERTSARGRPGTARTRPGRGEQGQRSWPSRAHREGSLLRAALADQRLGMDASLLLCSNAAPPAARSPTSLRRTPSRRRSPAVLRREVSRLPRSCSRSRGRTCEISANFCAAERPADGRHEQRWRAAHGQGRLAVRAIGNERASGARRRRASRGPPYGTRIDSEEPES
jgi:hypothetical protein